MKYIRRTSEYDDIIYVELDPILNLYKPFMYCSLDSPVPIWYYFTLGKYSSKHHPEYVVKMPTPFLHRRKLIYHQRTLESIMKTWSRVHDSVRGYSGSPRKRTARMIRKLGAPIDSKCDVITTYPTEAHFIIEFKQHIERLQLEAMEQHFVEML